MVLRKKPQRLAAVGCLQRSAPEGLEGLGEESATRIVVVHHQDGPDAGRIPYSSKKIHGALHGGRSPGERQLGMGQTRTGSSPPVQT